MAVINAIKAIVVTSIDSADLSADYQVINTGGLPNACFILRIINDSTEGVLISYNGTDDNDYVEKGSVLQLPFQANSQPNNFAALIAKGTVIYAKGVAGTGDIYVAGYYLANTN